MNRTLFDAPRRGSCDIDLYEMVLKRLRQIYGNRATLQWGTRDLVDALAAIESEYESLTVAPNH